MSYTITLLREDQPKTIVSVEMVVGDKSIIWDTCGMMGLCPECTGKDRGCGKPYAFAECTSTTYYTANLSDGTICLLNSDEYDHILAQLANGCHAGKDGDCIWPECPQLRDGEPAATGQTCPLGKAQTDE